MAQNTKGFDCETCYHKHCDKTGDLPDSRGPAPTDKWEIPGVIKSRTCLLPMITSQSRYMLRLYGHYQHRILPNAGGLLDQPNWYIQAMEIFDEYLSHAER